MTAGYSSIVLGSGVGRKVSVMGVEVTFKVVGAEIGGAYFCMEYAAPAGWAGPPRHIHHKSEKAFYILDGGITPYMGDREIQATAGCFAQMPRGTPHTFANLSASPAKYLILALPAGLEGYFEQLPELVAKHGFPPPPELLAELGRKYDFEAVGPRLSK